MIPFAEPPFTINGIKSWIHCLDLVHEGKGNIDIPARLHYHDYIEFLYALNTDAYVWINGERHRFASGDFFIINSGDIHCAAFAGPSHYICVKFSPTVLYSYDTSLFEFKYITPFLSRNSHPNRIDCNAFEGIDIRATVAEIMDEWNNREPAFELMIRSHILKIFSGILRHWEKNRTFRMSSTLTEPIKKALIYISKNYEYVTEADVANACGLSYNHFSFCFKNTVGQSFNDYLTMVRINEAGKLLLLSDKSITEIAMQCGFSSSSHFISRFKQYKQITPGKFRSRSQSTEYIDGSIK